MRLTIKPGRRLNPKTGEFEDRPRYYVDGREVTKRAFDRAKRPLARQVARNEAHRILPKKRNAHWPMQPSVALAVHPKRAKEAAEDAKKKGVPTEFTPKGRPIFTGPGHYKAYRKAYGFHFNNGFES